jgi:hypothetical protein
MACPGRQDFTMANDELIVAANAMRDEIVAQCEELAGCVEGSPCR